MISLSLAVLLAGCALGAVAIGAFAWAWRAGHFEGLEAQSRVIFEPRDERLERPWESEAQRAERVRRFGRLEAPRPGEWGGAG